MRSLGLPTSPLHRSADVIAAARDYHRDLAARRDEFDLEIDGIVIKLDDLAGRDRLGATPRHPRWVRAWKFAPRGAETVIEDIRFQVGRSGVLTPIALVHPVAIGGVRISRATLHNAAELDRRDLRIGDRVRIVRAGDVIPEIVERIPRAGERRGQRIQVPGRCPSCGTRLETDRCPNRLACPAQLSAALRHLGSRGALDIRGLGKAAAERLVDTGLVTQLTDVFVAPASFGAALYYFTGSKAHGIAVRTIARAHKLKINEYGVFRGTRRIAGTTEEQVLRSVGLRYIPPELREDRGEIAAARAGKLPKLIDLGDLRGDLQMHTSATDGRSTLAEMVEAARALGREYIAITDHTRVLRVTRGLDRKGFLQQRRAIAQLNERGDPPVVLWGAEVDILEDGALDLDEATLAELDLVVVAVHTHLNMPREAMTARVVRALHHPRVSILGHPTSRLLGKRAPSAVDIERVIAAAADTGVLLEINAQPDRLDLDDIYARTARDAGAGLVISTDAHHVDELRYLRHGVDQARRGWCEARHIASTLHLRELQKRLRR